MLLPKMMRMMMTNTMMLTMIKPGFFFTLDKPGLKQVFQA